MPTNKDRALTGRDVIRWNRDKRDPGRLTEPVSQPEDIIEILVNLRHFCRWYGFHHESLDRAACQQFEEQTQNTRLMVEED